MHNLGRSSHIPARSTEGRREIKCDVVTALYVRKRKLLRHHAKNDSRDHIAIRSPLNLGSILVFPVDKTANFVRTQNNIIPNKYVVVATHPDLRRTDPFTNRVVTSVKYKNGIAIETSIITALVGRATERKDKRATVVLNSSRFDIN